MIVTLYHSSYEQVATIIDGDIDDDESPFNESTFKGLFFASSRENACGLGENNFMHEIEIDEADIASTMHLEQHEQYVEAINAVLSDYDCNDDQREVLEELILERSFYNRLDEEEQDDVKDVLRESDDGEADWHIQMLRGQLAKKLGYKAVEMRDEHGTSYLVLAGVGVEISKCYAI